MSSEDIKRRLAAILSADVKDYSRLMRQDEAATVRTLTAYREIMATLIRQHHGRVVDSPGDNLLAEFASVVDAVQGAVAIQRELKAKNAELPEDRIMAFRIGINLGDVIVEGDQIYGDGVNIAARLEALADPGGICISRTAYDQIEDKLPFGYEFMGEKRVKNIAKPVPAYKVLLDPQGEIRRAQPEEDAGRWEGTPPPGHIRVERRSRRRDKSKNRFQRHLRAYLAVMGFLLIIDLLSGGGLWFYWPALGWGWLLFLHWSSRHAHWPGRKAEMHREDAADEVHSPPTGGKPRYLRIQVEPKDGGSSEKGRVNVRVPLGLLRAGVKVGSVLPEHAKDRINAALQEKGVDFDLSSLEGEKIEELLASLLEGMIDIDDEDRRIRVFCE